MGGLVRIFGWGWLLTGWAALASGYLVRKGLHIPIPEKLAVNMSVPWSALVPTLGLTGTTALLMVGFGVLVNALVFLVIANILDR